MVGVPDSDGETEVKEDKSHPKRALGRRPSELGGREKTEGNGETGKLRSQEKRMARKDWREG